MAGLLTHIAISLILFSIVVIIFKRFWYGAAIFIGQLIPDAIKFGITGIKLHTFSPSIIVKDELFWTLERFSSNYHTWLNIGILTVALAVFFVYMGIMKKKQAKEISWAYLLFAIGVAIHLIIDIFIIEKSYWI